MFNQDIHDGFGAQFACYLYATYMNGKRPDLVDVKQIMTSHSSHVEPLSNQMYRSSRRLDAQR